MEACDQPLILGGNLKLGDTPNSQISHLFFSFLKTTHRYFKVTVTDSFMHLPEEFRYGGWELEKTGTEAIHRAISPQRLPLLHDGPSQGLRRFLRSLRLIEITGDRRVPGNPLTSLDISKPVWFEFPVALGFERIAGTIIGNAGNAYLFSQF